MVGYVNPGFIDPCLISWPSPNGDDLVKRWYPPHLAARVFWHPGSRAAKANPHVRSHLWGARDVTDVTDVTNGDNATPRYQDGKNRNHLKPLKPCCFRSRFPPWNGTGRISWRSSSGMAGVTWSSTSRTIRDHPQAGCYFVPDMMNWPMFLRYTHILQYMYIYILYIYTYINIGVL